MIYHSKDGDNAADSYSLTDLDAEAKAACRGLKPHLDAFDVIAVTGLSGILPGVACSLKLGVPLAVLRKPHDDSHQLLGLRFSRDGSKWVGGEVVKGCRVLWLDDFSSSGSTRVRIKDAVAELGGQVVGEYMTRDGEFVPWKDGKPHYPAWNGDLIGFAENIDAAEMSMQVYTSPSQEW